MIEFLKCLYFLNLENEKLLKMLEDSSSSVMNPVFIKCIQTKQECLFNIFNLYQRMIFLYTLSSRNPKEVWMKVISITVFIKYPFIIFFYQQERSSTYWEKDVALYNDHDFKENFRMSRGTFHLLCVKLKGLSRHDNNFRLCISLEKRIAIAVYALASSAEYRTVGNLFGVSKASVCIIVLEFCAEVWKIMQPEYLNFYPLKRNEVQVRVEGFRALGFPQCIGAIGIDF